MIKILLWVVALQFLGCTSLPYKDDVGFLVSAQANSPEFPVYLNGHLCTDMEGNIGSCSKRVKSTEDVSFSFDSQVYAYLLTVNCTTGVGPSQGLSFSVAAGQGFSFTITHDEFSQFKSFTCIGEVSPQDRAQPLSAKWDVRFNVVDARYSLRERIYMGTKDGKNGLVLGQYARNAWVFDEGKWTQHSEDTIVEIKGDPKKVKAYSESFAMRFNYFNLGDADSGAKN